VKRTTAIAPNGKRIVATLESIQATVGADSRSFDAAEELAASQDQPKIGKRSYNRARTL
jgi:hypothetical protein